MRRLLIVCVLAVLAFSLFSVLASAQKASESAPTSEPDSATALVNPSTAAITTGPDGHAPLVLASGAAFRAVALDPNANLYVTNASAPNRIFTVTGIANLSASSASNPLPSARLALVAGNGTTGSLGDGGSALASQFNLKLDSTVLRSGIAIGSDGTMFVADTLNSTIRRISGSDSGEPGIVRSIAGHWGPRQEITLGEPLGLALDRSDNLYIADRAAGTINVLPSATDSSSATQLAVLAHVASPASIALTVDGAKAFVASPDTGAVFEIDTQTRAIRSVAGFTSQANAAQQSSRCTQQSSPQSQSSAVCPAGLAVDGGGNLFVSDASSGRVLRVDAKSQQMGVAASGLKSPGDMTFDASGNLYVAEQGANRLLKFAAMGDPAGNLTIGLPNPLPPPPAPRRCPVTAPFSFCDQPTGGATATQAFTLTNNTAATVSGLTISFNGTNPGDFQAPSNNCGTSLGAGMSCLINVDFAPSAIGARTGTLSVVDSAGDTATANVSGTGDDYQVTLNGTNQEQSVFQGGVVTFKFNITPDAVFGGVVNIVCPESSQLPSLTTCTPNPASVTVTPGTAAAFTVTFATTFDGVTGTTPTTPGGVSLTPAVSHGQNVPPTPGAALPRTLPAVFFVAAAFSAYFLIRSALQSRRSPILALASLTLVIFCTAIFLAACHHSSIQAGLNTPVGTTNLTIQGSAQNAARGNTITLDVVAH